MSGNTLHKSDYRLNVVRDLKKCYIEIFISLAFEISYIIKKSVNYSEKRCNVLLQPYNVLLFTNKLI